MQFYVKDIMSTELVTVGENETIRELVKVFTDGNVLGVPVIDDDGYVVGVVSSTDVLKKESSHNFYYAPFMQNSESILFEDAKFFDEKVSSIMTKELFTILPDETVAKMAKEMYEKKIHRLLVTDYEKLIGIVSTFDALKLLATSDEEVIV
jgi:CBS domain-containing protein